MPIYFTSETHFGDARRIRGDKRPFASIAEHDAALIARWNEVVSQQDEIYHLGDFTAAKDPERVTALLAALNGRKHLIIGNNDAGRASRGPPPVSGSLPLSFRTWNYMGKGAIDIHGHSRQAQGRAAPI